MWRISQLFFLFTLALAWAVAGPGRDAAWGQQVNWSSAKPSAAKRAKGRKKTPRQRARRRQKRKTVPLIPADLPLEARLKLMAELPTWKLWKLVEKKDGAAMLVLARRFDPAFPQARGVKKSLVEAARWYRRAAQKGLRDAQYRLARIVHEGGEGIRRSARTAAILYEAAARQGHVRAMFAIGWAYDKGEGVIANQAAARRWYRRAAEAGHAGAMTALGLMYLSGRGGPRDLKRAVAWLKKAAAADDAWAVNDLGVMYEMGWGVTRDLRQARKLFAAAVTLGVKPAESNLRRVMQALKALSGKADKRG